MFKKYDEQIDIPLIIDDYYVLKEFCKNVVNKLDNRCEYCYLCRLEKTVKCAKENALMLFLQRFRHGQNKAREIDIYIQDYCGCVFSEEERYEKLINKNKIRNQEYNFK